MTGEEKRQKLKEQYKKELLERRAFIEKAKALRKMQRINKALTDMESAMHDDSDQWIDILNQETALSEAKMEMMMEDAALEVSEEENKLNEIQMQAEMAKKSAEDLVRQMKIELGLLEDTPPEDKAAEEKPAKEAVPKGDSSEKDTSETATEQDNTESSSDTTQSKTLGDF